MKASREAKVHTRWVKPNLAREAALQKFVASILDRNANAEFISDIARFQKVTSEYGMLNGLSQTLLKLACPGVPDFYQGSETWDLRLVDPDNRSPVCFHALDSQLAQVREIALRHDPDEMETLVTRWQDGRIKVHLIQSALAFRRTHPQLFENGTFDALTVAGEHAKRAFAFRRSTSKESAVVVIPRCVASLKAPLIARPQQILERHFNRAACGRFVVGECACAGRALPSQLRPARCHSATCSGSFLWRC